LKDESIEDGETLIAFYQSEGKKGFRKIGFKTGDILKITKLLDDETQKKKNTYDKLVTKCIVEYDGVKKKLDLKYRKVTTYEELLKELVEEELLSQFGAYSLKDLPLDGVICENIVLIRKKELYVKVNWDLDSTTRTFKLERHNTYADLVKKILEWKTYTGEIILKDKEDCELDDTLIIDPTEGPFFASPSQKITIVITDPST